MALCICKLLLNYLGCVLIICCQHFVLFFFFKTIFKAFYVHFLPNKAHVTVSSCPLSHSKYFCIILNSPLQMYWKLLHYPQHWHLHWQQCWRKEYVKIVLKFLCNVRVRTDLKKSWKMTLVLENSWNSKKVQFVLGLSWNFEKISLIITKSA